MEAPRTLIAPNPSAMTLDGTRTFIVGRERPAVIDPGPDDPAHLRAILDALGGASPAAILLTHSHGDHVGDAKAIALANDTRYGLAAYVWTNNLPVAIHAAEKLQFGMVGVNEWTPQAVEAPFVGWKESGIGREAGAEGLEEYLETKLVAIGGVQP